MLHKTLEAKATVTDLGQFEAVAAAYTVDRVKDRIVFGAFAKTIAAWQASGKRLPLHWNHSGAAEDIIGSIDAMSLREVEGEGLRVKGNVDLEGSEVAKEAWRSMKANALALSFGYIATKTRKAKGGIQELLEIDLFEVSVVPAPANPDTRFIDLKSAPEAAAVVEVVEEAVTSALDAPESRVEITLAAEPPSEADLAKQEQEQRLGEATKDVPKDTPAAPDPVETLQGQVTALSEQFEAFQDRVAKELGGIKAAVEEPKRANSAGHDPLRKRSDQAVLDIQSDGISSRKPPRQKSPEPVEQAAPEAELKARSRRQMLELLTGVPNDQE